MKTWKECCDAAEVPDYPYRNGSSKEYIFYSNGSVVARIPIDDRKTIQDMKEKYTAHEVVYIVDDEYDEKYKNYTTAYQNALSMWEESLQKEYSTLTLEVFNLCYNRAYERGHASGYDEIASCMSDVVEFAEKLLKAHNA
jgi:flagellar biosynthesis/type III secretory pathway protein FliH